MVDSTVVARQMRRGKDRQTEMWWKTGRETQLRVGQIWVFGRLELKPIEIDGCEEGERHGHEKGGRKKWVKNGVSHGNRKEE